MLPSFRIRPARRPGRRHLRPEGRASPPTNASPPAPSSARSSSPWTEQDDGHDPAGQGGGQADAHPTRVNSRAVTGTPRRPMASSHSRLASDPVTSTHRAEVDADEHGPQRRRDAGGRPLAGRSGGQAGCRSHWPPPRSPRRSRANANVPWPPMTRPMDRWVTAAAASTPSPATISAVCHGMARHGNSRRIDDQQHQVGAGGDRPRGHADRPAAEEADHHQGDHDPADQQGPIGPCRRSSAGGAGRRPVDRRSGSRKRR